MLSQVLAIVHRQGWFDITLPHEKTIFLSQGASLWMILSRQGSPHCFVKFSDLVGLSVEAVRCTAAGQTYPNHAPEFLGHARDGTLEVLANRAVEFEPLKARDVNARRTARQVADGLHLFFQHQCRAGGGSSQLVSSRDWIQAMPDAMTDPALRPVADRASRILMTHAADLPSLPQHGDFVMNNLGVRRDGRLVVFDWEDFGALDLPGLDLFTLEYSLALETGRLDRNESGWPAPPRALDLQRCCLALGLNPKLYEALRLSYAVAFRYLKRQYGPEVQARLDRLIRRLSGLPSAAVQMP